MLEEYYEKNIGYRSALYGYMQVLFTMLIRKLKEKNAREKNKAVFDITDYVDKHIFEKISLSDIAANCFYNPSYFSRKFKDCYGKNLRLYISEMRLKKAAEMLKNTSDSVLKICTLCGFSDKGKFYRDFKKVYGCTPIQYRNGK